MDLKNYSTGVQHIGIPTNDIDKTVDFYHKLGFETLLKRSIKKQTRRLYFLSLELWLWKPMRITQQSFGLVQLIMLHLMLRTSKKSISTLTKLV